MLKQHKYLGKRKNICIFATEIKKKDYEQN